jgi:hypothetical protein
MAAPLNTCTTIKQRGFLRFLWAKNMAAAKDIHKEMLLIWAASIYFAHKKTHNATLFYRGTCIQGHRHLVTAATSAHSCAYQSLCVTIKLDSAAI